MENGSMFIFIVRRWFDAIFGCQIIKGILSCSKSR